MKELVTNVNQLREIGLFDQVYITELKIYKNMEDILCLSMLYENDTLGNFSIEFKNIEKLEINDVSYNIYFSSFMVENMSSRQWEKINWEIYDYEEKTIHFYCDTISLESLSE